MEAVELTAIALQGLDRAQAGLEKAAGRLSSIAAPPAENAPADTIDLSAAAVGLLEARQDFAANLNVLKTADRMERKAIDLLA
jgi:flagellar hook protein FlgE